MKTIRKIISLKKKLSRKKYNSILKNKSKIKNKNKKKKSIFRGGANISLSPSPSPIPTIKYSVKKHENTGLLEYIFVKENSKKYSPPYKETTDHIGTKLIIYNNKSFRKYKKTEKKE